MCAKKENKVTPRKKLHQKTSKERFVRKEKKKYLQKKKQEKST